jgi:hypothetical protein
LRKDPWAAERSIWAEGCIWIHGPWANVKGAAMLFEFMKIRKITMCTTAMGGYMAYGRYAAQIQSGLINSGEATV